MDDSRRRRRASRQAGAPPRQTDLPPQAEAPAQAPAPRPSQAPGPRPAQRRAGPSGRRNPEQGMADLIGAGPTQLDPVRAMRARDADRPGEQDLADAARTLVVVRRHWQPPPDQTGQTVPVRS